jgi:hypothetical protein
VSAFYATIFACLISEAPEIALRFRFGFIYDEKNRTPYGFARFALGPTIRA